MSGQWLAVVFFFASTVATTALERQSPADMVRLLQDVRIPTKSARYSNSKPATYSDLKPAGVPTRSRPPGNALKVVG